MLVPLALPGLDTAARQSVFAVAMAAPALGSAAGASCSTSNAQAIDSAGPTCVRTDEHASSLRSSPSAACWPARPDAGHLDLVMGVLEETFRYRYPSVYLWDGLMLRLGAQRNYRFPIETIAPDRGIVGRIVNAREPAFLPDARQDPDFLSADPDVVSEIAIPLQSDDELFGVLNVETNGDRTLDEGDSGSWRSSATGSAALSLALGRERRKLTERAALLDRLTTFATILGSSLDPATMDDEVAVGAATVIPPDTVVLVSRDESGRYVINAVTGGDRSILGKSIKPGEGVSGEAMTSGGRRRRPDRAGAFPKAVSKVALPDTLAAMAAPMVIVATRSAASSPWLRRDLGPDVHGSRSARSPHARRQGRPRLRMRDSTPRPRMPRSPTRSPACGTGATSTQRSSREDAIRRRSGCRSVPGGSAILFDLDHSGPGQQAPRAPDRRPCAAPLRRHAAGSCPCERSRCATAARSSSWILDKRESRRRVRIAEDIRTAFEQRVDDAAGEPLRSTVFGGLRRVEASGGELCQLTRRADVALSMATADAGRKNFGGRCVAFRR